MPGSDSTQFGTVFGNDNLKLVEMREKCRIHGRDECEEKEKSRTEVRLFP
jgi:hypothetical protein